MSTVRRDTLSPLYGLEYRSTFMPRLSTEVPAFRPSAGFEGAPVNYSPQTDPYIPGMLLVCFLVSALALARGKRFLILRVKDFFLHRERSSIFDSSTANDVRYLLTLNLQTCLLTGILFFLHFHQTDPQLILRLPSLVWLVTYTFLCLVYLVTKWLLYSFLGWTFLDKKTTDMWLSAYSTIFYILGLVQFLFVLFLVYNRVSPPIFLSIGLSFLIIAKLLMLYKWTQFFFRGPQTFVLLILYFCALEILPCLVFYQVLEETNRVLTINL